MNSSRDHSRGDDATTAMGASRDDGTPKDATGGADRLGVIEAEVAFQGDTLRELGNAFAKQQMDILTLQRQVQLLGKQLAALRDDVSRAAPDGSDDEPPPHY